jgi:hypothetical protein
MNSRMFLMLVAAFAVFVMEAGTAHAQIGVDDIIVTDFFDDILSVENGAVTDLFDIAQPDSITSIAIASPTVAYVVNFLEIWKIDLTANSVTLLTAVEGNSPAEISMDLDGNLLFVSASHGVNRIDTSTGQISLVYDDVFFDADDIAVSAEGIIYVTEFFDGLGKIGPGGWQKLGDWNVNFFSHIDIGPDGYLYCATTFENGDIYRINPYTGMGSKIADNVYDFIDDLQVASDGTIYIAGNRDTDGDGLTENVVFTVDPLTGELADVVDENMVGNPSPPFFNPMDIEIFDNVFYLSAPAELSPVAAIVNRGLLSSGSVEDLADSDNVDMVIQRSTSDIQARIEVDLLATSISPNPEIFEFTFEASVFARSAVVQTIYLFNFESNQFEEFDSRPAERFSDQVVVVAPTGNLSRFVEPATNAVEARIRFESTSQRQQFSSNIDQARWTIR